MFYTCKILVECGLHICVTCLSSRAYPMGILRLVNDFFIELENPKRPKNIQEEFKGIYLGEIQEKILRETTLVSLILDKLKGNFL